MCDSVLNSVLEFDVGVIHVNDNEAGITLGTIKADDSGDIVEYFFTPTNANTIFEAKDLYKIAECLESLAVKSKRIAELEKERDELKSALKSIYYENVGPLRSSRIAVIVDDVLGLTNPQLNDLNA